jgi:hypothetical protein
VVKVKIGSPTDAVFDPFSTVFTQLIANPGAELPERYFENPSKDPDARLSLGYG